MRFVGIGFDVVVPAVFDEISREIDPATGAVVTGTDPTLGLSIEGLPAMPTNDHRFIVRGTEYAVRDVQQDGVAGLVVFLQRVP